jgi:hypothetical protein
VKNAPAYALCEKNPEHGPLLRMRDGSLLCPHSGCMSEKVKPAVRRWHPEEGA